MPFCEFFQSKPGVNKMIQYIPDPSVKGYNRQVKHFWQRHQD